MFLILFDYFALFGFNKPTSVFFCLVFAMYLTPSSYSLSLYLRYISYKQNIIVWFFLILKIFVF